MALIVKNLDKEFPTRAEPLSVLRGISLSFDRGDAVAVMGPSGSGKSTFLDILATLDRPTRGQVTLEGNDPFVLSDRELAHYRNQKIGMIFQDHHLLPQFSVLENVLLPTLVQKTTNPNREKEARDLLEQVGMSGRLDHRPAELSGGERQRVAVARALIQKPILLLADEPTGNLDRKTAVTVGQLLLDLQKKEQMILIVVTHSAELAETFPKRMEMSDGTLVPVSGF